MSAVNLAIQNSSNTKTSSTHIVIEMGNVHRMNVAIHFLVWYEVSQKTNTNIVWIVTGKKIDSISYKSPCDKKGKLNNICAMMIPILMCFITLFYEIKFLDLFRSCCQAVIQNEFILTFLSSILHYPNMATDFPLVDVTLGHPIYLIIFAFVYLDEHLG